MISNHLNRSLRDFEREITEKESELAQRTDTNGKHSIVSRLPSKPSCKKPVKSTKRGKISSSESSTRKCALGKQSALGKPHSISSARAGKTQKDSGENVIHKEIIENTGATVEITVRTMAKDRARKRSCSRSRMKPGVLRNRLLSSKMLEDDAGSVDIASEKTRLRHPVDTKRNHRPWCELLKSKDSAYAWYKSPANVGPDHLISCAGKTKSTDVNESGEPSENCNEVHAEIHVQPYVETVNGNTTNIQKDYGPTAIISSQKSTILLDSPLVDVENCAGTCDTGQYPREISTVFTVFDPMRILNFLVRELQGIVSKNSVDGGSMKRIVSDMEATLRRLPECYECVRCKQPASSLSPPSKPYESSQRADVTALAEANQLLDGRCSQLTSHTKKLEAEVTDKSKTIEVFGSKEKEYLQKIYKITEELTQMKKKNDEQMEMLTNLSKVTFQLKNENKVIVPLREAQSKLNSRLEEMTQNMEKLETELQLVKLERDKFRLLLDEKTKDVEGLKQLVKNIQFIVSEQLTNLKNLVQHKNAKDQLDNVIHAVSECSVNGEVRRDVSSVDRGTTRPRCSSPTSSVVSSTLGISPSWQMISKISNSPEEEVADKASSLIILAHGMDSNVEEYSLDETVRLDDSKELEHGERSQFCSLQSVEELSTAVQGVVDDGPSSLNNNTVHVSVVQGHKTEARAVEAKSEFRELCKVFQGLGKSMLFIPEPFHKRGEADNSSDYTDYSDNS